MHAPRGGGDRNHPAAAGAGYGDDSRLGIEGVIEKPASKFIETGLIVKKNISVEYDRIADAVTYINVCPIWLDRQPALLGYVHRRFLHRGRKTENHIPLTAIVRTQSLHTYRRPALSDMAICGDYNATHF